MERLPYFDTHAHLDTEDFDADREALLKEIGSHMLGFINPGCDVKSSKASLAMAHRMILCMPPSAFTQKTWVM